MITEYLLERIEATLTSKTSALLVYKTIMTKLDIHVKVDQTNDAVNSLGKVIIHSKKIKILI